MSASWPGPVPASGPEAALAPAASLASVDVVIPSLDTRDLLRRTLETLCAQEGVALNVCVVDMSSADGSVEMLREGFRDVRLLADAPNRGYGAAVNAGVRSGSGEWVLACNSDVVFEGRGVLAELLAVARDLPRAGVLGPRLLNADGSPQPSAHALPGPFALAAMTFAPLAYLGRGPRDRALGRLDESAMREPTGVGWVSGALLLIRREVFEGIGGFDESFFMNSEEVDLCARVREAGYEVVFVPGIAVTHLGGGSTPSAGRGLGWLAEGHWRYTRKHYGGVLAALALALAWVAWLVSLPVWIARAAFGKPTLAESFADARAYASAIRRAPHVR